MQGFLKGGGVLMGHFNDFWSELYIKKLEKGSPLPWPTYEIGVVEYTVST